MTLPNAGLLDLVPMGPPPIGIAGSGVGPGPIHVNPAQLPPPQQEPVIGQTPQLVPIVIPDEDVKMLQDMFPSLDAEVLRVILENERGNKDRAINSLLQMTNET